jgi:hypothetical protein
VVNLPSRSRIKNWNRSARSPRSISRLRACWATQAPVGCAVIPPRCTRRSRPGGAGRPAEPAVFGGPMRCARACHAVPVRG